MNIGRWLCGCVLLAMGMGSAHGQEFKLEWGFKIGEQFYLEQTTDLKQSLKFMGATSKKHLTYSRLTRLEIKKKEADNSYLVEMRIEKSRLIAPTKTSEKEAQWIEKLAGATFQFRLDQRMRVSQFQGYPELIKRVAKDDKTAKLVRSIMPVESLSLPLETVFAILPSKPVKLAEEWERIHRRSLGALGRLQLNGRVSYHKALKTGDQTVLVLKMVQGKSSYTPATDEHAEIKVLKGNIRVDRRNSEATYFFSPGLKRLIAAKNHLVLDGTLTVNALGATLVLDLEQDETVSTKVLDKKPSTK